MLVWAVGTPAARELGQLVGGSGDDWQVCWWEGQEMTGRCAGGRPEAQVPGPSSKIGLPGALSTLLS